MDSFDYKEFVIDLANQARTNIQNDIAKYDTEYLVNIVYSFGMLCYEAIDKDKKGYTLNEKQYITQMICEWTFNKGIDLTKADIKGKNRDEVLQKVAFVVLEVAKITIEKELSKDDIKRAVEYHVRKTYVETLYEMKEKRKITQEIFDAAMGESNIDKMAEEEQEKPDNKKVSDKYGDFIRKNYDETEKRAKEKKGKNAAPTFLQYIAAISFFLLWVFLCIISLMSHRIIMFILSLIVGVRFIYENFSEIKNFIVKHKKAIIIIVTVLLVLKLAFFVYFHVAKEYIISFACLIVFLFILYMIWLKDAVKKDVEVQMKKLDEIRQDMQDLINPNKMYEKMGVDTLELRINVELLQIADPDQDGQLLAKLAALRVRLTNDLGYVIPNVRIQDDLTLEPYEYSLLVRGDVVLKGKVYPNKYMVLKEQWDKTEKPIPQNTILGIDPTYGAQVYWLDLDDIDINLGLTPIDSVDVILKSMRETYIKYVDKILTTNSVYKMMEHTKSGSYMHSLEKKDNYYADIIDNLVPELLSVSDIRKILVNLIREKVSIKDIAYIFEKLLDYARFSTNPNLLNSSLRVDLGRKICFDNSIDGKLYAVTLSKEWEEILTESCENTEFGTIFSIEPEQMENIVKSTSKMLLEAGNKLGFSPVILCSPQIRLPLFQLLVRHIPTIVVLSYSELITDIEVKQVGIIE